MIWPVVLCILSGIFFGSWSIALKNTQVKRFENFYLVLLLSIISFSSIYIFAIEGFGSVVSEIFNSSAGPASWGLFGGAFWGANVLLFGYLVTSVGLAITYGLVVGVAIFFGTTVTMFFMGGIPSGADPSVYIFVMFGVATTLVGILLTFCAGLLKTRAEPVILQKSNYRKSIPMCVLAGILGSFFALGYAGARVQISTWTSVLLLLIGYSCVQLPFLVLRIVKARGWHEYRQVKEYIIYPLASGLIFAAALITHYASADEVGVALTYPLMLGIQILVSNIWSFVVFKEWQKATLKAKVLQMLGLAVVLVATVLIGRAMGFVLPT